MSPSHTIAETSSSQGSLPNNKFSWSQFTKQKWREIFFFLVFFFIRRNYEMVCVFGFVVHIHLSVRVYCRHAHTHTRIPIIPWPLCHAHQPSSSSLFLQKSKNNDHETFVCIHIFHAIHFQSLCDDGRIVGNKIPVYFGQQTHAHTQLIYAQKKTKDETKSLLVTNDRLNDWRRREITSGQPNRRAVDKRRKLCVWIHTGQPVLFTNEHYHRHGIYNFVQWRRWRWRRRRSLTRIRCGKCFNHFVSIFAICAPICMLHALRTETIIIIIICTNK